MSETAHGYVMGHSDRERKRLALQASILHPLTMDFFKRAGIGEGMHVLDVGCGVGDVSMIVAELVGPTGSVTGIDIDAEAVSVAREKASEKGHAHARFEESGIANFPAGIAYDAVVGRHILIHLTDPVGALKTAFSLLKPGGVAAFHEYDLVHYIPGYPTKPLNESISAFFSSFFGTMLAGDIALRLPGFFLQSGFVNPQSRAEALVDVAAGSKFHEWLAETVRTILPKVQMMGGPEPPVGDVETLAERLREEAQRIGGSIVSPMMVGTFAKKP